MRLCIALVFLLYLLPAGLAQEEMKGLKDYYADYFTMGVSVGPRNFSGPDSALIVNEFASITAENIMKMGPIHPTEDRYNWEYAYQLIDFAETHNLKVRGHTLCWHNQVGDWMFEDERGETVSKTVLLQRLKDHIFQVAGRYRGKIYAWDVVNEAISDAPDEFYRNSKWYQICGEDFIFKAFEYAHEAAPDALLFYNDYSAIGARKRNKIIELIKKLQAAGIPIHGMGIQGHWSVHGPDEAELRAALSAYAELGLEVQITELDLSVYPSESGRRSKRSDEDDSFTAEREQQQIDQYRMIFGVFRDFKDVISAVTFWNVSDRHSWLDNFPVRGRKNYPLLFDQERQRKPAYRAVVDFE
ncbi:endo-1,4-beta-xylanase [Flavilitoribacter nigricans]|uniref:Beta-xylanase n=1 Tax=Flavilitoribacter nigricans (strain ATCC 23147 / DSM 23189 / NBRC 102662 / NCIMB 1420 / SS-2) TaxID=1122177 RepID=A0A2D0N1N1_FLAN2|nr:endo-1,4-beta-xylanase [Flavilitoribacter nigricans]PHN01623.1 1,4-beta-xylanase [Flavilitoribacter nigricans DSM 23189 = NBRC 102662]